MRNNCHRVGIAASFRLFYFRPMHFGRVEHIEGIDLRFPPDSPRTEKFLDLLGENRTEVYIGCPIWASQKWVGNLYPRGTKSTAFLKTYSRFFRTVEVNSTFYQLLDRKRIELWRDETPPGFKFCPKVFRGITEDPGSPQIDSLIAKFCVAISGFGDRLGLPFAQFPETFGPSQIGLLRRFLSSWPSALPLAVELRHPDWFQNHALLDEAVNLFYRHRAATVITDTLGRRDVLHLSLTQPKVLIRFQGNRLAPQDAQRLSDWAQRIAKWRSRGLEEIYFFTHQPEDGTITQTGFLALEKVLGQPAPDLSPPTQQLELGGF